MSPSLEWTAKGIEDAERAGGIVLDRKHRIGFARIPQSSPRQPGGGAGFPIYDPDRWKYDPEPDDG